MDNGATHGELPRRNEQLADDWRLAALRIEQFFPGAADIQAGEVRDGAEILSPPIGVLERTDGMPSQGPDEFWWERLGQRVRLPSHCR